jgi:hypothetical protein
LSFIGPRQYDEVELHAVKGGIEILVFLSRSTAFVQMPELELDGWDCDIREVGRDGTRDGLGAQSSWAAARRRTPSGNASEPRRRPRRPVGTETPRGGSFSIPTSDRDRRAFIPFG